jgi:hypothetical protein
LFNGLAIQPNPENAMPKSIFIVSHLGEITSLDEKRLTIIGRMLNEMPSVRLLSMGISKEVIIQLRRAPENPRGLQTLREILTPELVNKIAFVGDEQGLRSVVQALLKGGTEKIVLSCSPVDRWQTLAQALV